MRGARAGRRDEWQIVELKSGAATKVASPRVSRGAEFMNSARCPAPLQIKGLAGAEYSGRMKADFPSNPDRFCSINANMDRQEILDRLRENERALRERGVTHAALFGSRARGDNRPDSDIDIMIDIAPEAVQDVYAYVGLKNYIAGLFAGAVDVVDREALKSYVRPAVTADAVYAF